MDVYRNGHHISIQKCCMSCDHKTINTFGERRCANTGAKVDKYDICKKWVLAIGLEQAGLGNGKVNPHCRDDFYAQRLSRLKDMGLYVESNRSKNEEGEQKTSDNQ